MGNAYIGVSDDFTASVWNPAGLAQMRRLEVMGGFSNTGLSNDATYHGTTANTSLGSTSLNNVGFVFPFPTTQGSLVFAFGYNRINNFASATEFSGFNSESSIIPSLYSDDATYDVPFNVYLTNSAGYSAVQKDVNQRGSIREGGGLGQWNFAGAIDIEENISFGVSLNVFSGTYDYTRNFVEEDTRNVYNNTQAALPADSAYLRFNKFYLDDYISSELNGTNIQLGLMYRSEVFRAGLTVKGASTIRVKETYSDEGQSVFDNNGGTWSPSNPAKKYSTPVSNNEYSVESPWTFGAGASLYVLPEFLIAADVEQTDWTQVQFSDNPYLEKKNPSIQKQFRSVFAYRLGAEFDVPGSDVKVRAGYSHTPSPYVNDPSSYDRNLITFGAGILLQRNVALDAAAAIGTSKNFQSQYSVYGSPGTGRVDESLTTSLFNLTVSYRF